MLNTRGVYHFAPRRLELSFSHIAVLDNGQLKVFSFVNCEGRGQSIRDVLEYLAQRGSFSDTVIARVRNYFSGRGRAAASAAPLSPPLDTLGKTIVRFS